MIKWIGQTIAKAVIGALATITVSKLANWLIDKKDKL